MSVRRALIQSLELLSILVVASLIVGQVLGYPVLLGFVETGSMEPTLEPGDGFVAIPTAIDGDIEENDVITFRAQEIQGGGLTTHRVVGETANGYVTKGDANPFTDQDGDEPPVREPQIVAKALQIGGTVVVIPNLGTAVVGVQEVIAGTQRWIAAALGIRSLLGAQSLTYFLLAASVLTYILDLVLNDGRGRSDRRTRSRDRDDGVSIHIVMIGLALLVVAAATAAMVVPAGTQEIGIISAEFDSEDPTVISQGESSTLPYAVPNAGLVPVHAYFESGDTDAVDIDPTHVYVGGRSQASVEVTLTAPPETGYYRYFLTEHRYLAVLPRPVIDALYRVHPWLPIVVIDGLLGGAIYLLGMTMVGSGRVRSRSREGPSKLRRLANRFG